MNTGFLPPLMENPQPITKVAQVKMLHSLGYFDGMSETEVLAAMSSDRLADAVAKWQAFHSRPITGELSYSDSALMLAPRCAVADVMLVSGDGIRQWANKDVTISHNLSGMNGLTQSQIDAAYAAAAESWNKVCGIRLKLVPWAGPQMTNIWARSLKIDGAGSTLAWSYLPNDDSPSSARLEQRYEPGESWSQEYLQGVAAHEIGHALGMEHSNNQADLMYPYARRNLWLPQPGDIKRVVQRYGNPETPTTPPGDPPTTPPTDPPASGITKVTVTKADGSTADFFPRDGFYSFT